MPNACKNVIAEVATVMAAVSIFEIEFPYLCARCFEGWRGKNCQECIKLSGCLHGDCDNNRPGTCKCHKGWKGALCDEPICREGCHDDTGYCLQVGN